MYANPLELKELLIKQNADLLVAGVKERFLAYKMGIAFCDYNHDRTISFEGYTGMMNFAREVSITINNPVWQLPVKRECGVSIGSQAASIRGVNDDIKEPCHS